MLIRAYDREMLTGIDHLVIACDPDAAAAQLEDALGLRAAGGGRHDALGTYNRIVWLGDSYLELVGVFDPRLAKNSWLGTPTLAALDEGGGLATYAVGSDDLAADVERLRSIGAPLDGPLPGERRRGDGRIVRWQRATPPRLGPMEPPFLIEHDPNAAEWTPDERAARSVEAHPIGGPVRLIRLELPVADIHQAATRYVRTVALTFRPSLAGHGARDASVGSQTIRLRRSSAPTVEARWPEATIVLDTVVSDLIARETSLLGCRWLVGPAA